MRYFLWIMATILHANSVVFAHGHQITIDDGMFSRPNVAHDGSRKILGSGDEFIPNDELFHKQWGLRDSAVELGIAATRAWGIEQGNKSIAIAVLDTGIDYTHPDLAHNMWVNPNEIPGNNKDDDNNGYIDDIHGINVITGTGDPLDDNGHGTHMAGVIGAEGNNQIGIAGVMHKVSLIACKFLDKHGSGDTAGVVRCLDYIADLAKRQIGVTIVATNNAWGGGPFSHAILDAIKRHHEQGILFVTASGSDGLNIDDDKFYPACYDSPNVIVTAKSNQLGNLTSFTNFGPHTVHLASPGTDILSTHLKGGYQSWSGSAATGFLSGTIGLLKAHNNALTGAQIKDIIAANVTKMSTVDDQNKLISQGRLNAFSSLLQ